MFSPRGLQVPYGIFLGGVQRSRLLWPGRGTRPRPPWTTGLGLLSSLLLLGLRLSVPLWRSRPVYVSVSVLRGLQSAHPPSPVELLRLGSSLPGGGSYVRVLSCASCVPRLLFPYLVRFRSLLVNSVPGVCVICVNYLVYLSPLSFVFHFVWSTCYSRCVYLALCYPWCCH